MGLDRLNMYSQRRLRRRSASSNFLVEIWVLGFGGSTSEVPIPLRSCPTLKHRPDPLITTTLTSRSGSAAAKARSNYLSMASFMAFSLSGRFNVIQAMLLLFS